MKILKMRLNGPFSVLLASGLFLGSCVQPQIDFNVNDSRNVENETASDAYFTEAEDLTTVTVSADKATAGGRFSNSAFVIQVNDSRFSCATVTLEPSDNSTLLIPKGILVIDFGSGCTDNRGTTRKGKIKITYYGRRFLPGSSVTTALDGYEINGVKIEGVRTIANTATSSQSNPVFTTTMDGGKITWPDGTSVLRDERTTAEWKPGATTDDNQWSLTGSASGSHSDGRNYTMTITNKLLYKRACAVNDKVFMAVQGTKELVVDNKKVTIDYGTGTCDKMVTVTILSRSKTVELK
jgi:hypothetical protein